MRDLMFSPQMCGLNASAGDIATGNEKERRERAERVER